LWRHRQALPKRREGAIRRDHRLGDRHVGTPAISLPLALHPNGLPIGVQIAAKPAREDIVIALGADLDRAMTWASRVPPLHASRL
jgi:Asp-tRNA(Asn)/Glu-tRNA(Gln) amidotransferase A subunit family amidase